jgi:hypothetical protein
VRPASGTGEAGDKRSITSSDLVGSGGSGGSVGLDEGRILDEVRAWWERFVRPMDTDDLDVLTLWTAHTHLALECYSSPRLVLDSPVPSSGKTTVLDHLARLCRGSVLMASLSSPAMLARLIDKRGEGACTLLIDEADRNLDPRRDGVGEVFAILNSGYRRGASRPVLVPGPSGGWNLCEMPTFAPVALAGNSPRLPDDTRSRAIRVLLVPDLDGLVEESDWEVMEVDARALNTALARWADGVRADVAGSRPRLPPGIVGRDRERWLPLVRVAADHLVRRDVENARLDREEDVVSTPPAVRILRDLARVWPQGARFVETRALVAAVIRADADAWGPGSSFGRELTAQRLGRLLAQGHRVRASRQGDSRGYQLVDLQRAWRHYGISAPGETAETAGSAGTVVPLRPPPVGEGGR